MTPALIGLAGRAGSGKDTVAALLKDVYGCMPIALADALKRFCVDVFGISPPLLWGPSEDRNKPFETAIDQEALVAACVNLRLHGRYTRTLGRTEDSAAFARGLFSALHPFLPITTPRRLLQLVGTEWGRALDLDRGHARVVQVLLDRTLDADVFMEPLLVVLGVEPLRVPGLDDAEAEAVRMNFLTHESPSW